MRIARGLVFFSNVTSSPVIIVPRVHILTFFLTAEGPGTCKAVLREIKRCPHPFSFPRFYLEGEREARPLPSRSCSYVTFPGLKLYHVHMFQRICRNTWCLISEHLMFDLRELWLCLHSFYFLRLLDPLFVAFDRLDNSKPNDITNSIMGISWANEVR